MKVKVSQQLFVTPGTVAHQASLSMGFSRQEYWSGLPFPSPVDLPDPGIEPRSLTLQADSLPAELLGKPRVYGRVNFNGELLRGFMTRVTIQYSHLYGESLPSHASTGGPPTLADSFDSVSCGVTAPFLWVLVHAKFCLCPPRLESLFPTVFWKAYNQILLALKARFPGNSQSLCWISRLGSLTWGSECSQ